MWQFAGLIKELQIMVTIFKINQYSSKKFSIMTYTFSSWISKLSDWIETFIKLWEKRSKRTKNVIRGFINIVRCGVWAVLCSIDWLMSWVSPEHIFAPTLGPDLLSWPAATHSSHPSLSSWWSWERAEIQRPAGVINNTNNNLSYLIIIVCLKYFNDY